MSSAATVTFRSEVGEAKGHLARPGKGVPGIIVLQEWWGLVPHIKDVAGRFAAQGDLALAPDLYHGKSTLEAAEAEHLMKDLDWARAAKEIAGRGTPEVGGNPRRRHRERMVVPDGHRYAQPGGCHVAFARFPAGRAGEDRGAWFMFRRREPTSIPDARAFADAQQQRGREAEVIVYPGAGHAFFNDTRPEAYREAAANYAWRRTLDHFGRHLRVG
jgi:carboxymethylenebutenolidase